MKAVALNRRLFPETHHVLGERKEKVNISTVVTHGMFNHVYT